jgi:cathepsin B
MTPKLILAGPALRLQDEMPVVTKKMIDDINSQNGWKASLSWVGNMTVGQARRMLGVIPSAEKAPEAKFGALMDYLTVPASFDSRTQWPKCVGAIRNQADCGSCWAFSATEVLADRYCIDQGVNIVLSPQWLVSCDTTNYGCGGGILPYAWKYLASHGVPADSCDPYTSGDNDESGSCSANCASFYKATAATSYTTPAAIQAAIIAGGPVQTAFTVYQDFMSYSSGVYVHKTGSELGGHAVKIIGWGVSGTQNYWIVANSWGTDWGLDGFFWIAQGQCGIDSDAIAGNAA